MSKKLAGVFRVSAVRGFCCLRERRLERQGLSKAGMQRTWTRFLKDSPWSKHIQFGGGGAGGHGFNMDRRRRCGP